MHILDLSGYVSVIDRSWTLFPLERLLINSIFDRCKSMTGVNVSIRGGGTLAKGQLERLCLIKTVIVSVAEFSTRRIVGKVTHF